MTRITQWTLNVIILFLSTSVFIATQAEPLNELKHGYHKGISIKVDGVKRTFNLSIPFYNKNNHKSIPALILLHGGGGKNGDDLYNANTFIPLDHINPNKFTKNPVLLVYPDSWINGKHRQWNDHRPETNDGVDDVKFIKKIKNKIVEELSINSNKVFISGVSNGGMLTYRIMCEAHSKFAGYAPVIANLPKGIFSPSFFNKCTLPKKVVTTNFSCKPLKENSLKKPSILIFGLEDTIMPVEGGCIAQSLDQGAGGLVSSAQETFELLHEKGRCDSRPSKYLDLDTINDKTYPHYLEYSCDKSEKLGVVYIDGAGHSTPNNIIKNIPNLPSSVRPSKDFNSPDFILDFFGI